MIVEEALGLEVEVYSDGVIVSDNFEREVQYSILLNYFEQCPVCGEFLASSPDGRQVCFTGCRLQFRAKEFTRKSLLKEGTINEILYFGEAR